MFVARMANPLFQSSTGQWVYEWVEQTINPGNGDYQDLAGGKSGSTSAGPFMRERNNTLVKTPLFSLARLRGAWSGQPLYDFEHCCSDGTEAASGSLTLGAMICDGSGLIIGPPPRTGSGSLLLGPTNARAAVRPTPQRCTKARAACNSAQWSVQAPAC
jgi:hypothetical protein